MANEGKIGEIKQYRIQQLVNPYIVLSAQPKDWNTNYNKYYIRAGEAPNYTYTLNTSSTWNSSNTYVSDILTLHPETDAIITLYNPENITFPTAKTINTQPADWAENYNKLYYIVTETSTGSGQWQISTKNTSSTFDTTKKYVKCYMTLAGQGITEVDTALDALTVTINDALNDIATNSGVQAIKVGNTSKKGTVEFVGTGITTLSTPSSEDNAGKIVINSELPNSEEEIVSFANNRLTFPHKLTLDSSGTLDVSDDTIEVTFGTAAFKNYANSIPNAASYVQANPQPTSSTFETNRYYTRSGTGTDIDPYVYTLADTYSTSTIYYELSNGDLTTVSAVKTYVDNKITQGVEFLGVVGSEDDLSRRDSRAGLGDWVRVDTDFYLHTEYTGITPSYELTTSKPADWDTLYNDYYIQSGSNYERISSSEAIPWAANAYYKDINAEKAYVGDIIICVAPKDSNAHAHWDVLHTAVDTDTNTQYQAIVGAGSSTPGDVYAASITLNSKELGVDGWTNQDIIKFVAGDNVTITPTTSTTSSGKSTGKLTISAINTNTWRPIKVNSVNLLTSETSSGNLVFADGQLVKPHYDSDKNVYFDLDSSSIIEPLSATTSGFLRNTYTYTDITSASHTFKPGQVVHWNDNLGGYQLLWEKPNGWDTLASYSDYKYVSQHLSLDTNSYLTQNQGIKIYSGKKADGTTDIVTTTASGTAPILGDSGIVVNEDSTKGTVGVATYSAIMVNKKGIAIAGGNIVEVGTAVNGTPSTNLAIGGIYYQLIAN